MSTIRKTVSLAANESTGDLLVREGIRLQLRTAGFDGVYQMALTQSAIGLEVSLLNGNTNTVDGAEPNVASVGPKLPDDQIGTFPIREGEQVSVPVQNTTAGAITLNLILDVPN